MAYVAIGNFDSALTFLDMATDSPGVMSGLTELKANAYQIPELDEPRFQELRDRIGEF